MYESIYEIHENGGEQDNSEHPGDLQLELGQQRLVVDHLCVEVVREHKGQVEVKRHC